MDELLEQMRDWVGRTERRRDVVTPRLVDAYRATVFDRRSACEAGEPVEPGLHWCLATSDAPMSELGPDGHPRKGGFLPPIPAPRRMWAGSRVTFAEPLRVGDAVERTSTIASVDRKEGRSGALWFVAVDHVHATARGPAVTERQDIVYRAAAGGPAAPDPLPEPAASACDAALVMPASETLLFRYSALTFNTHRIHYDHPYARQVEHYAGLVVHGPLQAALLLRLAMEMRKGAPPGQFAFRGMRPLIAGGDIACRGAWIDTDTAELWTGVSREVPFMQARASW